MPDLSDLTPEAPRPGGAAKPGTPQRPGTPAPGAAQPAGPRGGEAPTAPAPVADEEVFEFLEIVTQRNDQLEGELAAVRAELDATKREVEATRQNGVNQYRALKQRTDQEIKLAGEAAVGKFVTPLLDLVDHLEAASAAAEGVVKEGIDLALAGWIETLAQSGITRTGTKGEPFNERAHQAIPPIEISSDVDAPTVGNVLRTGWVQNGQAGERVLRAAVVTVIKPSSPSA